jgi:protein SCO1
MATQAALNPSRRRATALLAAAPLLMLGACDRAGGDKAAAPAFKSVDITGADYARELALPDPDGKVRTLADWKGKAVVVFFGYTQCPDVCPTTMAELAEARRSLGADGDRVQGVFVTVDPERDTPEVLKAYVANFGAGFVGLRGTPEQTKDAAKHFKVFYSKVPGRTDTSYTIDHTAGAYVFDPAGKVRLFSRYGAGPKVLADDLRILLATPG